MAAATVATFIIFSQTLNLSSTPEINQTILLLTFGLASLMVSTIRFPSFKELNWRSRASFGLLLVSVLVMILIAVKPEVTLFLILSSYICLSLVWNVALYLRGEPTFARKLRTAKATQSYMETHPHGQGD
jgi:CDP-diacylglycerol--serine O-phosphatidyltransferase